MFDICVDRFFTGSISLLSRGLDDSLNEHRGSKFCFQTMSLLLSTCV